MAKLMKKFQFITYPEATKSVASVAMLGMTLCLLVQHAISLAKDVDKKVTSLESVKIKIVFNIWSNKRA